MRRARAGSNSSDTNGRARTENGTSIWDVNRDEIVSAAAEAARSRQRIHRQARPHQPRGEGREGRPALRLCRAGRRRRREGPRRLRPRQGARSAGGDPQGDRSRQARPDPRSAARRPHAASRRARPPWRRTRSSCAQRLPAPASSPAARCARCSRRSACRTWWRSRSARPIPTTWCARPSMRSSIRIRRARLPRGATSRCRRCRRAAARPARRRAGRGLGAHCRWPRATIKVKQIGSPIRRHHSQRETLIGLGLNRIGRVAEVPDTPQSRGMIAKVKHLVQVVDEQVALIGQGRRQ